MSRATRFRDFVEQVRAAADIVDVIGKDVELKPSGQTLVGLSPFRPEQHPSFTVWPHSQSWCDFSGNSRLGGDVFAYVQQRDKASFKEALLKLAKAAGIRRPDQDEAAYQKELHLIDERREIERLLFEAARHYHSVLPSSVREQWLQQRYGFNDDTIDSLMLGWADGHLYDYFTTHLKVGRDAALKTGLFIVTKDGVKDFFRDRIVFPYWKRGQVVYFIARATQYTDDEAWEQAKYKKLLIHSNKHAYVSETVRNDQLYNEDSIRGAQELIITEGVTDCISAIQAGFPCISPVTTRFRKQDIDKLLTLTRHAKCVIICNDNETSGAGADGALETAEALFKAGRDVRIATIPLPDGADKIDLNEFLKTHSADELLSLLESARRFVVSLLEEIPADTPKIDLTAKLKPILEQLVMRSPIEQDGYVDLICKRFGIGKRDLKKILHTLQAEAEKQIKHGESDDSFRGEIFEDLDHYFIFEANGGKVTISSFQIEPRERIDFEEDGEVIIGDITTQKGGLIPSVRFPWEAWRSNQCFLRILKKIDLQWSGQDVHLQGVLRLLASRDVPIRTGTRTIGHVKTKNGPRWVTKELVLGPDGPVKDDIVFDGTGSDFPDRVTYRLLPEPEIQPLAREVLPGLLELNEPAVVLPILGWFFATPFKPHIMKVLGHFPILMVWGSAGSGKTSVCKDIFWRLFGINPTEPFSVTDTDFSMFKLLSSSNAIPVFLDEYKPSDMPRHRVNALHRLLRRVYGGEVERRGRPDQGVNVYRLTTPICMAGETRPDNAALVDRLVSASPNKNRLEQYPEHAAAFQKLRNLNIYHLAPVYVQFTLQRDVEKEFENTIQIADNIISRLPNHQNLSIRGRDNQRVVVFGLTMFEAFAKHLGVDLPELDVEAALSASVIDLMDGEQGGKNPLDLFLETCSVMAFNGELLPNKHFAVIDGLTCLHFRACWEIYCEHCRRVGHPIDDSERKAIMRMAKENHQRGGYVKEVSKTVALNNGRPRTLAIDLKQAAEFLEVDSFPETPSRDWGGHRDLYND